MGNIRLAFYKNTSGNPAIDRTTDFYPFGLEFGGGGSNSGSTSPNYTYGFQEQEKQQDTGWSSFKWRNYDPTMGRFFNIDPLSEKYAYQSHYNFSEDCVINSRELEGLEKVFFQNVLFKDERFQKAYQAERQTTGGKEFSNTLSSQNKINVLYTNFSNTNATGIAPLINNKKEFSDISKDFKIGVSAKEYDKISENGSKKIQLIGVSFGDKKTPAFDVAATLNHEEVAHSTEAIKKNEEQSNASGHKSYYGEYREASPEDKAVLTDKKYEGTKANINLKELEQILEKPEK